MADFLSLLLGIPSLISNFNGSTTSPYQKQQEQLAGQQAQYAQALANPQSPLYQQNYNRYQDQNRASLAEVISQAQGKNRLASKTGRTPLFSQDRGGEQLFRAMMQQYQGMGAKSDEQTRGALKDAAGVGQQAQNQYGYITPNTVRANTAQLQGYTDIHNMLGQLQQSSQQQSPQNAQSYLQNIPRNFSGPIDPNSSFAKGYW